MAVTPPAAFRLPIIGLVGLTLLAALWAGLLRLGLPLPSPVPGLPAVHGPLMVLGVVATLISLERAVALGRGWGYLAPATSALSALLWLVGASLPGTCVNTVASAVNSLVLGALLRRQVTPASLVLFSAGLLWLAADLLWLEGLPPVSLVPWWVGFLSLTIVSERLELSRLRRLSRLTWGVFAGAIGIVGGGLVLDLWVPAFGDRLVGLGLLLLTLWLGPRDLAGRTVRQTSLARFSAVGVLVGYGWLGLAGLLWLGFGAVAGGPLYDAQVHTFFLGFVFSMIFAHAPLILPAISGRSFPFHSGLYGPLGLLHLSLLLRLGGDLLGLPPVRQVGGLLNVLAILVFLAVLGRSASRGGSHACRPQPAER